MNDYYWQNRRTFGGDTQEDVSKAINNFLRTIPGATYITSITGGPWRDPATMKDYQFHSTLYWNIFQEEEQEEKKLCTTIIK